MEAGMKRRRRAAPSRAPVRAKTRRGSARVATPSPAKLSIAQQAYEAIKLRIISLEYRPGACLAESRIAEDLGLGRMPVHEAITRLALEDMLEVLPRKGVIVPPISLDEALANIEARLINEPAITRLAVERATADEVDHITAMLHDVPAMIGRRDIKGLMVLDRQFHASIARCARNPFFEWILRRLHERSLRFWFVSLSDPKHMAQVHDEHLAIVDACRSRDGAAAERAVRAHLESFRDTIKRSI
jgi:DNA-binding GntR family transcriptional regulator